MQFFTSPDEESETEPESGAPKRAPDESNRDIAKQYATNSLAGADPETAFYGTTLSEDEKSRIRVAATLTALYLLWDESGGNHNDAVEDYLAAAIKRLAGHELFAFMIISSNMAYLHTKEQR